MPVIVETKESLAAGLVRMIQDMDPEALDRMIAEEAGEELVQFFLRYAAKTLTNNPRQVLGSAVSLMIVGYLAGLNEQRRFQAVDLPQSFPQQPAEA